MIKIGHTGRNLKYYRFI